MKEIEHLQTISANLSVEEVLRMQEFQKEPTLLRDRY